MTEYTTDSNLNADCISIAEELEAHANGRAYEHDHDVASAALVSDECGSRYALEDQANHAQKSSQKTLASCHQL